MVGQSLVQAVHVGGRLEGADQLPSPFAIVDQAEIGKGGGIIVGFGLGEPFGSEGFAHAGTVLESR